MACRETASFPLLTNASRMATSHHQDSQPGQISAYSGPSRYHYGGVQEAQNAKKSRPNLGTMTVVPVMTITLRLYVACRRRRFME